ncbi:hypothetical protein N9H46_00295 [Hellea sp.]|nr:hypothetical protein [Hellea sp.]
MKLETNLFNTQDKEKQMHLYTGKEVIAHAVAVDRHLGFRYIKSHEAKAGEKANFSLLIHSLKDPKTSVVGPITEQDYATADKIVDYFEGLVFKAMQRELSEYEKKITDLIKAEDINLKGRDDRLPIVGSLPNVYRNNTKHDVWADEERSLRKTSEYEGELKTRGTFNGVVKMSRYMNRTNSLLVALLTENGNIVKFFYDLYRTKDGFDPKNALSEGKLVVIEGFVKGHDISKYSKCKETFINRVNVITEDK